MNFIPGLDEPLAALGHDGNQVLEFRHTWHAPMELAALSDPFSRTVVLNLSSPSAQECVARFWADCLRAPVVHHETREAISALVSDNAPSPAGVTDADMSNDDEWESTVHTMIAEVHARRGSVQRWVD